MSPNLGPPTTSWGHRPGLAETSACGPLPSPKLEGGDYPGGSGECPLHRHRVVSPLAVCTVTPLHFLSPADAQKAAFSHDLLRRSQPRRDSPEP